jgi:hypothetical protein
MVEGVYKPASALPKPKLGAPPIPHEHGAWVILYAPFLIGLAAAWPPPALPAALLFLAATGAYLARHAAGLLMRKNARRDNSLVLWLGIYSSLTAVGVLPLLFFYDRLALLPLAGVAVFVFGLHALILKLPMRNKLARAQWSEMVGMTALTLTAPGAYIAAGGALDGMAVCLWVACAMFFGSGVLHVRMLLFAAKEKAELTNADRWRLGRANLIYHALLIVAVFFSVSHLSFRPAMLVWLGFLPVLVRAVDGTISLSHETPSFKKCGLVETGYALWFTLCFISALHSSF